MPQVCRLVYFVLYITSSLRQGFCFDSAFPPLCSSRFTRRYYLQAAFPLSGIWNQLHSVCSVKTSLFSFTTKDHAAVLGDSGLTCMLQVDSPVGASAVAGEPASSAARKHKSSSPKDGSSFLAQQSQGMQRPQDRFEDAVDNSNRPFVHNFEHVRQWQVNSSMFNN